MNENDRKEALQEVREKLIKIEMLLEGMKESNKLTEKLFEEKMKTHDNRISELENSNKWVWRTLAGAIIGAAISFIFNA